MSKLRSNVFYYITPYPSVELLTFLFIHASNTYLMINTYVGEWVSSILYLNSEFTLIMKTTSSLMFCNP